VSWLIPDGGKKKDDEKEKDTMSQRFFTACLLILGGAIALTIAIEFLAQIWGWLVLGVVVAIVIWILARVAKSRQDRW